MQLAVRIPDHLVSMLDEHVDGVRYHSRAQLITVIMSGWLDKKEKECPNMTDEKKSKVRTPDRSFIPAKIVEELEKHVDKIRHRSMNHLIHVILLEWVEKKQKQQERLNNQKLQDSKTRSEMEDDGSV